MANAEEVATKRTKALTKEHQKWHDYEKRAQVTYISVGDLVWLQSPSKLTKRCQAACYFSAETETHLAGSTCTIKAGDCRFRSRHGT